jgi:glycyl-tRNA synthetase beta chain
MHRGELLLELLSEEIPARMQRRAIEDLSGLLRKRLAAAEIPTESLRGYVTPRRLAIIAEGIPTTQPDRVEERRGPRVGAPQPAIDGFLRSVGFAAIDECEIRDTGRGEFYFAVVKRPGRPSAAVLPELIKAAMAELPWPKSMRYPASDLRWIRPLTSVLCLFDGEVLSLPLDRIPIGRTTRGHRFLAPNEIGVSSADEYLDRLRRTHVILDQDIRKELIRTELDRQAADKGLAVRPDLALLEEVTGLVEFPIVLMGGIDSSFQTLPPEVLATAMRSHQKYFACLSPDGALAPYFLFVANNRAVDGGEKIVAGNERVLRARLADARFFWDQDRRVPLVARVEALKDRVFHAKLGNMRDRVDRIEKLAIFLKAYVPGNWGVALARRAALLAKADLSSGLVGEFPELQGIMGRYYALYDDEDPQVADAIAEHYKPLGPSDWCPTAPVSVTVALADKIITLVGFFGIAEKPSGSKDPFALRRAALGIIRLIIENRLRLPLRQAFKHAIEVWDPMWPDITGELLEFITDRLKVHLRDAFIRHDLIAAVFAHIRQTEGDLFPLLARVDLLRSFLELQDGANLLTAYLRASNIVAIEERKDGHKYVGEVDPALLQQPEERALADHLAEIGRRVGTLLSSEEFEKAMTQLARLRRPIDDFFDKVTVNCEEQALRENRLRLLSGIRETMNRVADFSQIEG